MKELSRQEKFYTMFIFLLIMTMLMLFWNLIEYQKCAKVLQYMEQNDMLDQCGLCLQLIDAGIITKNVPIT